MKFSFRFSKELKYSTEVPTVRRKSEIRVATWRSKSAVKMVSTKICCVKRIICNDLFVEIELDLDLFAIFSSSKN